jgi:hypothetical protein
MISSMLAMTCCPGSVTALQRFAVRAKISTPSSSRASMIGLRHAGLRGVERLGRLPSGSGCGAPPPARSELMQIHTEFLLREKFIMPQTSYSNAILAMQVQHAAVLADRLLQHESDCGMA